MSTADNRSFGPAPGKPPPRLVFLDALRLVAAFQMIQGHAIDALLAPAYRSGALFRAWTFSRGLTSTAFLFAAGCAFAIVTADDRRRERGRAQRLRRGAQLVAIGYLLHAPFGGFFGAAWDQAFEQALIVDVLQCIGVSLWLLEALAHACRGVQARLLASAVLSAVCFVAASASAAITPQGLFAPLLHYFSPRGGSLFPLLPWSGYVFAGYGLGVLLTYVPRAPRQVARLLAGAATALVAGSALTHAVLSEWTQVAFFVLKLGLVVLSGAGLAYALSDRARLSGWLEKLASETLFLYVSHVFVLYATGVGLSTLVGRTLSPWAAAGCALAFLLACSASALAYRRAREALR